MHIFFAYSVKMGYLTKGYVKPRSGTSKRTAAGAKDKQIRWHKLVTDGLADVFEHNQNIVGIDIAKKIQVYTVVNTDEANIQANGTSWKIVGSRTRKKHDNQHSSSRCSISVLRTGSPSPDPADSSGPTFILCAGSVSDKCTTVYTPAYLVCLMYVSLLVYLSAKLTRSKQPTGTSWRRLRKLCSDDSKCISY